MADTPESTEQPTKVHVPQTLVKAVEELQAHSLMTITVEGGHGGMKEDLASLIAAFLSNNFDKNRVYLRQDSRPSWTRSDEGQEDLLEHFVGRGQQGIGERSFLVRAGTGDAPTWTMDPPSYEIPDKGLMFLDAERKTQGPQPFLFPTEAYCQVGKSMAVTAMVLKIIESSREVAVRLDSPIVLKAPAMCIEAETQVRKVIRSHEQLDDDIVFLSPSGARSPSLPPPGLSAFGLLAEPMEVAVHLSLSIDCSHHTIDYAITNIPLLRGKRSKLEVVGLILELVD